MRKRTILALAAVFAFTSILLASPVDPQRAIQVAQQFVPKSTTVQRVTMRGSQSEPSISIVYTHMMPNSDRPAFYIINVEDGAFVLVSADDIAHQVLGYNLSSKWPVSKDGSVELPEHIKGFFDDLAAQMESAIEEGPTRAAETFETSSRSTAPNRSPSLPDSVDPLLTTTWNQGTLYNSLCPKDANGPDGHAYAGCVATAMAQIVKYYSNPASGRGTHSYESIYGSLSVTYDNVTYDFANMPDALMYDSSPEQIAAVSKLIYHCGVATNMEYGPSESAAMDQDARAGLINFFRFSPDMSFVEKSEFSDEDWNYLLRQEIASSHPVMYSGHGYSEGHSFVLDGYKSGNYYHFNFGWGGFADGWFLTNAVSPSGQNYSSNQSAIIGITPDTNSNVIIGQTSGTSTFYVDEPLEFCHTMGHNTYEGKSYPNNRKNTVSFISAVNEKQLVVDIIDFEDQNIKIYDGFGMSSNLRELSGGGENDLDPVESTKNSITLLYSGVLYYPGFKLLVSQKNERRLVSNIVSYVEATSLNLTWKENGPATQWQIEYGLKGFELGKGTVYNSTTNSVTFNDLLKFTEYDFYIRSRYNDNEYGPWNKKTILIEAPYWQDVVKSQPEGFVYDKSTKTIYISSAEGLAWWSKNPNNTSIKLLSDIDLGKYKWRPIPMPAEGIKIDGNGYSICNLYIKEPSASAFFEWTRYCRITDLSFQNPNISGSLRSAVIFAQSHGDTVKNVSIEGGKIKGTEIVGTFGGETGSSTFTNCYTKDVVVEGNKIVSLFIGSGGDKVLNCYTHGKAIMHSFCYVAGIMANQMGGDVRRCYSVDIQYGVVGAIQGGSCIDTSSVWYDDGLWKLRTPIVFDTQSCNILLNALNNEVMALGDSNLYTWIIDKKSGLPVFGAKYEPTCPNVSDLTVHNIIEDATVKTVANWKDNGASSWQIKVIESGLSDNAICYSRIVHNTLDTIVGLTMGKTYDIYVRSLYDDKTSGWGSPVVFTYDKPFWIEMVKERPSGYVEDANGNVTITSSEGLAWLARKCNIDGERYSGKQIDLKADLDLSSYQWEPISNSGYDFNGIFNGNNHVISNISVNSKKVGCGLFGTAENATIKNVVLEGGCVKGDSYVGGLIGFCRENCIIDNCHSSVEVFSNTDEVGSLGGSIYYTKVSNCSSSGDVHGTESVGGLIGHFYSGTITNSYSSSNIYISNSNYTHSWYIGGLIGYFAHSNVYNCYSSGTVTVKSDVVTGYIGTVIGCSQYDCIIQYLFGPENSGLRLIGYDCDNTSNTSDFHNDNRKNTLNTPVNVNNVAYSDLLNALNAWITWKNDENYKVWVLDDDTGFPILGDFYEPLFYNPTDLKVKNATKKGDSTIQTKLTWTQIGTPDHWEILYVAAQRNIKEGSIVVVNSNPCVLSDIPVGHPLDFYVRAVYGNGEKSNWSTLVRYIPDKLRWTEVVTSRPNGYTQDSNGNVYISSAEGLAWLSSVVNGLNGTRHELGRFDGKQIVLTSDIDISDYRWTPIGKDLSHYFPGASFIGNNHVIYGLYCNEIEDFQGLIGFMTNGTVRDVIVKNALVYGENYVGGIVGYASCAPYIDQISFVDNGVDIINCSVEGTIVGISDVGGIAGRHYGNKNNISNSSFIGNVSSRKDITKVNSTAGYIGGICGSTSSDSIDNCYVTSKIQNNCEYPGIITGSGGLCERVSHCYYLKYATNIPITRDITTTYNNSSFSGDGYTWSLNTPPNINGSFYTDLIDALNAWVDENNTNNYYRHWVADTNMFNGGYPIFEPKYVAPTNGIIHKYLVQFRDDDGTLIQMDKLKYGDMPTYRGPLPPKESDSQFTYEFLGWSSEFVPVTGFALYTAKYKKTTKKYIIKFCDENNTVLQIDTLEYGSLPKYHGTIPTKESSSDYIFEFKKWTPDIVSVTADTTYTIEYDSIINRYYKLIYKVDGEEYKLDSLRYGSKITVEQAPIKEGYSFSGWSEVPSTMPAEDIEIIGSFKIKPYRLTYILDGKLYKRLIVTFGYPITPLDEPIKEGYTFSGWKGIPTTMPATDVEVTGSFTVKKCIVKFCDENNTVLQIDTLEYGSLPEYHGTIPTKESSSDYIFEFKKWTPDIVSVTDDATYTVEYDSIINRYYKLIYKVDGEVYKLDSLRYGSEITVEQAPIKEGYSFSGWSEVPSTMPAEDIEITGSFITKPYKLIYFLDGKLYKRLIVAFGSPITPLDEPIKEGYTFSGWKGIPTTMPATEVEVTGSFTVNKYLLTVLAEGKVLYSDSITYGTKLIEYAKIIIKQGIDLSGWEWYSEIDKVTMPAYDVVINTVIDAIIPVQTDSDDSAIHDLTGRKIEAKEISTLPAGIYIRNGRKYIIQK